MTRPGPKYLPATEDTGASSLQSANLQKDLAAVQQENKALSESKKETADLQRKVAELEARVADSAVNAEKRIVWRPRKTVRATRAALSGGPARIMLAIASCLTICC